MHLAAPHLGPGHVSGTRKFLGQRTGTSGAGEGRDVVLGSIPAPGSGPRGAGQPPAGAALDHQALPFPGARPKLGQLPLELHTLLCFKKLQVFVIEKKKKARSSLSLGKTQSSRERRNHPSFTIPRSSVSTHSRPFRSRWPSFLYISKPS